MLSKPPGSDVTSQIRLTPTEVSEKLTKTNDTLPAASKLNQRKPRYDAEWERGGGGRTGGGGVGKTLIFFLVRLLTNVLVNEKGTYVKCL